MCNYEDGVKQADEKIEELKQERKGFWNRFNGYRNYCNDRIAYWKEYKQWCLDHINESVQKT